MKLIRAAALLAALGAAVPLLAQDLPSRRPDGNGPTDWTENPIKPEISGFINYRDSKDAPMSISVRLQSNSGILIRETRTGKLGEFSFPIVACGDYVLAVDASGYRSVRVSVEHSFIPSEPIRIVLIPMEGAASAAAEEAGGMQQSNVPEKAHKQYQKGLQELGRRNPGQSIDHFRKATEIYPKYELAYMHLGWVHSQQREFVQAQTALEKALELNASNPVTHALLGNVRRQQNRIPEAVQELERSLRLEEAYWRAHEDLGEILLKAGKVEQAYPHLVRAHQLNLAPAAIHLQLYNALILRDDFAGAAAELDEFLQLYPKHTLAAKVRQQREGLRAKLEQAQVRR